MYNNKKAHRLNNSIQFQVLWFKYTCMYCLGQLTCTEQLFQSSSQFLPFSRKRTGDRGIVVSVGCLLGRVITLSVDQFVSLFVCLFV